VVFQKPPPNCRECIEPLRPENRDAVEIWQLTESQLIVAGMGSVVGVNQLAVWAAIDRYRVKDPVWTFEKVLRLFDEVSMPRFRPEE